MKLLIVTCLLVVFLSNVLGEDKQPTKEQVEAAIKQLVDHFKGAIKELDADLKAEKDTKMKEYLNLVKKHVQEMIKSKEKVMTDLKKDGDVKKAIAKVQDLVKKFQKEMKAFHEKYHPA